MLKQFIFTALATCLGFAGTASAQPAQSSTSTSTQQPNDYADSRSWLCRPGEHDACDADLTATVVRPDGRLSRETWTADANAPIDCFYVYPTVSTDPAPNSDMTADPAELNVIRQQFARFGSKCRRYAPLYRQVTLAGLRRLLGSGGGGASLDRGLQYDDVRDAWNYYLEHDNKGRGFVLIGHSQGSFILAELIRKEIDGKPVQSRMVSAILPGATLAVPRGDYALFLLYSRTGWQLIVNTASAAWGTDYDAKRDVGRTVLSARTRSEPEESLTIYLVPETTRPRTGLADLRGRLRIVHPPMLSGKNASASSLLGHCYRTRIGSGRNLITATRVRMTKRANTTS